MAHKSQRKKKREIVYVVKKPVFYKNIWFYISIVLLVNLMIIPLPSQKNVTTKNDEKKEIKVEEKNTKNKEKEENKVKEINFKEEFISKKVIMKHK